MAENESLDLGGPYAKRWDVVCDHFRVPKGQSQKGVIQLLARYRDEWTEIASAARERGHAWARLLAPKRSATQEVIHASA